MPYLDKPRSRDQRLGQAFTIDDRYERLLTMSESRREEVLKQSPVTRISYGSYTIARAAALRLEQGGVS